MIHKNRLSLIGISTLALLFTVMCSLTTPQVIVVTATPGPAEGEVTVTIPEESPINTQAVEPVQPTAMQTITQTKESISIPIDIVGIYTLRGTNFDGSVYQGEVTITKSDNMCILIWRIGNQQSQTGTGTFNGTQLTTRWQEGKYSGDAIYTLQPDGSLIGVWTQDGHDGQGTETLILKK